MNACEKCGSKDFDIQSKNFPEDLHKIVQVFVCKNCGRKTTKLVDVQEG